MIDGIDSGVLFDLHSFLKEVEIHKDVSLREVRAEC